jgi:glutathionylspermidine synthase
VRHHDCRGSDLPARIRSLAIALTRWQRAAGDFWPYVGAAPFVSTMEWLAWERVRVRGACALQLEDESFQRGFHDRRPPAALARAVADAEATAGQTAIFVDLPATAVLPVTAWLNRHDFVVVPIIQRWVAFPSVLDCSRLIDQLVAYSTRCCRVSSLRGVVFVLDGERAGRNRTGANIGRFDNRYAYAGGLFPNPGALRRHGIRSVRWVSKSDLAPDLNTYAAELVLAGFQAIANEPSHRVNVLGVASGQSAIGPSGAASGEAHYRRFARRAQCGALLADNLVRGEPYLSPDPLVLTTADDTLLRRLTTTFARAFDWAAREIVADVPALEEMGFPWVAAQLLQTELPRRPTIGRFDFVQDTAGGWRLLEYNADTPSGIREAIGGEEAVLTVSPSARRFARPNVGLRDALVGGFAEATQNLDSGATLGLVTNAGELEDVGQTAYLRHVLTDSMAARGIRIVLGDVDNLRSRQAGLYLGDARVDALYRLFPFESTFGTAPFAAIYDAVASGRLVLLNGLFGLLLQHKGLMAWLWARRADAILSDEERAGVQEHLPPTYNVADWNAPRSGPDGREDLDVVVKQVFGREGEEVFFGSDLTSEQWQVFRQRRTYIVQRRVPVIARQLAVASSDAARAPRGYATIGSFVVNGRWAGYYSRFGGMITTSQAKWVATLKEHERNLGDSATIGRDVPRERLPGRMPSPP